MWPDLKLCDPQVLDLPDRVVAALLGTSASIQPDDVMLVGARCRDVLHSALGHAEDLALTGDVDVGLVVADLSQYDEVVGQLDATGHSGIRYVLDGVPTDLMPFGGAEDPAGTVAPVARGEELSVWAFRRVARPKSVQGVQGRPRRLARCIVGTYL